MTEWPPPSRNEQQARGLGAAVLLHGLGLLLLLLFGRHLLQPVPRQAPLIPVDVIFGSGGEGGSHAATAMLSAPRDTTPKPVRVTPKLVPKPPADPLEAQLAALAQARAPDTGFGAGSGSGAGNGRGRGYTIKDLVRAQILRHWSTDAASAITVAVHVVIAPDGVLQSVAIVDQYRYAHDAAFRDVAISMRNAVTLSSPFDLPPHVPASALDFTLDLSPRDAVR